MTTLAIVLTFLTALFLGQVVATHATAKFVRSQKATWRRAFVVVLIGTIAAIPLRFITHYAESSLGSASLIAISVGALLAFLQLYVTAYDVRFSQSLVFLATQILFFCAVSGIVFPLKWYVFEAYKTPTNSMAPTIVGEHATGQCPICGGSVIVAIPNPPPYAKDYARRPDDDGICSSCFEFVKLKTVGPESSFADRIITLKFQMPDRWDVATFQRRDKYPEDRIETYVKRVVGLPGDEIVIQEDGRLLINGTIADVPAHIGKIKYTSRPGDNDPMTGNRYDRQPLWGDPRRPMKLGPDEYFVLGDNTHRALDARFWGPVKRDAIVGTATLIYWPPNRWRIFK